MDTTALSAFRDRQYRRRYCRTEVVGIRRPYLDSRRVTDLEKGDAGAQTICSYRYSADRLVRKPADLSWELAGAVGAVGQTALTVLDGLRLPAGSTVLVHGGSGGVGTMIVQLLVAAGHTVVATAGADRADYLRELGAIPLAYGPDLPAQLSAQYPDGFAASIDLAGTTQSGAIGQSVREAGGQAVTIALGAREATASR